MHFILFLLLFSLMGFGCAPSPAVPVAEAPTEPLPTPSVGSPVTDKTSVSLFFVDEGDGETCRASGYEKRTLGKTQEIAQLALTELLKGSQKNMRTEIPEGTTLSSLSIDSEGIAHVDFGSGNEAAWSGGSCHVSLIRSQISQTLMQTPGVMDIVITVNGKGEDDGILQP